MPSTGAPEPEIPSTPFVPTPLDLFAHAVDLRFPEELHLLGEHGHQLLERVRSTRQSNESPERAPVFPLLLNALTTSIAMLELWRRGLLLQVGILLRAGLEGVAAAMVVTFDAGAHRRYLAGRYKSSAAPSDLKRLFPDVGAELAKAIGLLSNEFVHVGAGHQTWLRVSPRLSDQDLEALAAVLLPIKTMFHLVDVSSEVVCWEITQDEARYWQRTGPGAFEFRINDRGQEWMRTFFKLAT